ncbi:hypothetical protein EYC59_01255 [Candidatus Saccharibacteria bacterium]|nr:MAG: hypothetical protein EYC59_01255 [Candidatus Saccharibacteria bacterium]
MKHTEKRRDVARKVVRALSSNWFFGVVLGVFVLQALWIALTAAYSAAFDEYFHLGIIRLYADQWSPLLGSQPPGSAIYGAVARDPSYLYQYLLSFPYRLVAHVTDSLAAQVVSLRLVDIAIFGVGLVVWRKVLLLAKLSKPVVHALLLFFVLIPATSFLAGQLNYDNLFFTFIAVSFYFAIRLVRHIREKRALPPVLTLVSLSVVLLGSLVKYAFLPIALTLGVYVLVVILRTFGWHPRLLWAEVKRLAGGLRGPAAVAACLLFLVSFGLFAERYAVNAVRYHTPVPDCDAVLEQDDCRAYAPFGRNLSYKEIGYKDYLKTHDKLTYPDTWARGMMRSLYFSVGPEQLNYPPGEPLRVAFVTAWLLVGFGLACIVLRLKMLWRKGTAFRLFLIVPIVYIGILFAQNLSDYLSLGVPVAMNGRYLLPVLLPLMALAAVAAQDIFRKVPLGYKLGVLGVLLVLTLNGGGITPYTIRSWDEWVWQNQTVLTATRTVRSILWPVIIR